jgi:hypothetical protein
MYAVDVVIFTHPDTANLQTIKGLLHSFGEASGLLTNIAKSSIIPIRCDGIDLDSLAAMLQCARCKISTLIAGCVKEICNLP